MPPRVKVVTWDLSGWGDIATALECAMSTARALEKTAREEGHPMPISRWGKRVRARSEELRAWADARILRSLERAPIATEPLTDAGRRAIQNPGS